MVKKTLFFQLLVVVLITSCTTSKAPVTTQVAEDSQPSSDQEVYLSVEYLIGYQRTTYYLRPGEDFNAVANLLVDTALIPARKQEVVEALAAMNSVYKTPDGNYSFVDTSVLAPVEIPYLQGFPSFAALGLEAPKQVHKSHVVLEGETLSSISLLYGFTSYLDFATACGIENPDEKMLIPGEVLIWLETTPAKYTPPS